MICILVQFVGRIMSGRIIVLDDFSAALDVALGEVCQFIRCVFYFFWHFLKYVR